MACEGRSVVCRDGAVRRGTLTAVDADSLDSEGWAWTWSAVADVTLIRLHRAGIHVLETRKGPTHVGPFQRFRIGSEQGAPPRHHGLRAVA
jgi:hypothetical protein